MLFFIVLLGCDQNKPSNSENGTYLDIQYKIALCTPVISDKEWFDSDNKAPLLEGLDVLNFPITTNNDKAQVYFNQGLILAYGFNHAEAARSFYYATRLDPACAMAYWGYAYVLGPNYNAGMEPDNYERAYNAIQKALSLSTEKITKKESDLINALSKRYVKEPIDDRYKLDVAYSEALAAVFKKYPDDADIGTLYAESLMDLHPWDIWDKQGRPYEWTPEILSTFDQVFAIDSLHPGAHHLYIHAVEASGSPEQGLRSARLYDEDLVPGAGHLVHMPAHIYIRTGDYHKGTISNIRSIQVDSSYLTSCHAQGTYPLTMYPHNYHFLSATATLEGNSDLGILAAQKVADHANRQLMKEPGWGTIKHYYTIPYYVNVKFGKWQEILDMENENATIKYPEAVRHYARGMAFLGLNDLTNAKKELQSLSKYATDESLKDVTIWDFNSTYDLLQIAKRVLEAEILADEGDFDKSIILLREAVALEDALNYQEPPDWFFSVRHHLGAVQIKAGKYKEAIKTYHEDLEILPKNGWALYGMKLAYANMGDYKTEQRIEEQLSEVWAYADVELYGSRIKVKISD
jgi:tetratricopeptide (TPR) repeat protein